VRCIAPAQVLKGLGTAGAPAWPSWLAPALALLGVALAFAPAARPGVPVAAYLAMLCLLLAGLAAVPALLGGLTAALQRLPLTPLRQLALARQRDQAGEARRSIAGVLIALALSVAMVVMIGSFRESLLHWLDQVLPADLYLRSSLRLQPGDPAPLPVDLIATVSGTPGVGRVQAQRSTRAWMAGHAEALELQARELHEPDLPLTSALAPPPDAAALPVYLNEAARDQLGLAPGQVSELRLSRGGPAQRVFVRAVWRDYARQRGAIWMSRADYQACGGDALVTELALKLAPGASLDTTLAALRALPDVEVISSGELRRISVQIFDQSFAITVWLQGVALAVGLFGVAAGASAQALARQREFGLLRHLGFSQAELRRLLWLEAGLLAAVGAAAGLVLGLALSAVLVFVVNPQSFHWTMEMHLPLKSLSALVLLALLASTGAAALAGRRAIGADAVRAVKEDW
jgi:putative ABC transport system permease protein